MAEQKFRVNNAGGMWLRSQPVVSEATKKVLLPRGQQVTKLGDTDKPYWWHISTTFQGAPFDGFSNKTLMVPDAEFASQPASGLNADLLTKTLGALSHLAPQARENYLDAIRHGETLFNQHGITTPQRMAHFIAQAMAETGSFTLLRESMNYSVPRMLKIFGIGHHSAKITPAEAPTLAHNEHALAERVYGFGNPHKANELGNTQP